MTEVLLFLIGIPCVVIVATVLYCAAAMLIEVLAAPVYLFDTLIERRKQK
jgi:hypothetical protein